MPTLLWDDGIALIQAMPNYLHYVVDAVKLDGCTFEIKIYFTDGSTKTYVVYTQLTPQGREIVKKQLLI